MTTIDLNLDAGEDPKALADGSEAKLYRYVTRVSVACGGHAGDDASMARAVELALQARVLVGAHPSYPDREHFGRRALALPPESLRESVRAQVASLAAIAARLGTRLSHVKPHGALYNQLASDPALAELVARAVADVDARLPLVGLAGSRALGVWRSLGFSVLAEGFADRGYRSDLSLVPRDQAGAIRPPDEAARQALELSRGHVHAVSGERLEIACDTICVHGDHPEAEAVLVAIRALLEKASSPA